jgi:hypothetical protein
MLNFCLFHSLFEVGGRCAVWLGAFTPHLAQTNVPNPDLNPPNPHVLGLPDPDSLFRGMDPDPSIIKQKK